MKKSLSFQGAVRYRRRGDTVSTSLPFEQGDMACDGCLTLYFGFRPSRGGEGEVFTARMTAEEPVEMEEVFIDFPEEYRGGQIFTNGFQGWTASRLRPQGRPMRRLARGIPRWKYRLHRYGDSCFFPSGGRGHRYQGFQTTLVDHGAAVSLWGSLSEKEGYTVFAHQPSRGALRVYRECDGLRVRREIQLFSLFHILGSSKEAWDAYTREAGWELPEQNPQPGWCSWYSLGREVNERALGAILGRYREKQIPLRYFQVDDGYQQAVGDWLEARPEAFPGGMASTAGMIRNSGYEPGIWLAPFAAEKRSRLAREHPDWLVRDGRGRPIPAGYNRRDWSGPFYALDFFNPAARGYLSRVFRQMRLWGYTFFKLDFLYAAAIIPRKGFSRGQIMYLVSRWLRKELADAVILGCGQPVSSAPGLTDYFRAGADVSPRWENPLLRRLGYPERVSTLSALQSLLSRAMMNGRMVRVDPDVFYLDPGAVDFREDQIFTLYMVAQMTGSLSMTSDDPGRYNPQEEKVYRAQYPHRPKTLHQVKNWNDLYLLDLTIGGNRYLGAVNLSGKATALPLEEGLWYENRRFFRGGETATLRPWQTRIFLAVPDEPYTVAGSTELLFPGSEVQSLDWKEEGYMTVEWHRPILNRGRLYIRIPSGRSHMVVNGSSCPVEEIDGIRVAMFPRPAD